MSDTDLRERIPFVGSFSHYREPLPNDLADHVRGIVARTMMAWPVGVLPRVYLLSGITGPPVLQVLFECEYRRAPKVTQQLATVVAWAHGPCTVRRVQSVRDVIELRDVLAQWPIEHEVGQSGT